MTAEIGTLTDAWMAILVIGLCVAAILAALWTCDSERRRSRR